MMREIHNVYERISGEGKAQSLAHLIPVQHSR